MRKIFALVLTLIACTWLALPALAQNAKGYYQLTSTKVDPPQSPDGPNHKVKWSDGAVSYRQWADDGRAIQLEFRWTAPPAELFPGKLLPIDGSLTVATNGGIGEWTYNMQGDIDNSYLFNNPRISLGYKTPAGTTASGHASLRCPGGGGDFELVIYAPGSIGSRTASYRYRYKWVAGGTPPKRPPTGGQSTGGSSSEAQGGSLTRDTVWTVNGHPVHWVFHANGIVEAPGLWQGTWKAKGQNVIQVTLTHQGLLDSFDVHFAPGGRSFTAYKDGQVYRNGVRR